ncbi:MAG: NAD(P)H-dependent oxidoreductase [Fimbriimonadaceae bacterium]|nr:NAD(P)H-dependent oxidoreductase [Fimbriimonadaceae bacterium]
MAQQARRPIRIVAVTGSAQVASATARALRVVVDELRQRGAEVTVIDPRELQLGVPGLGSREADVERLQTAVREATGVVFATPEYHGSYSSTSKLLIDNLGFPSALAGKPVALLGVAAGALGAVKALEHLRSVLSHVGALVLPGVTSLAGVHGLFDADGAVTDEATERRLRQLAQSLLEYIHGAVCPALILESLARGAAA